jgi:hypothetical protein
VASAMRIGIIGSGNIGATATKAERALDAA